MSVRAVPPGGLYISRGRPFLYFFGRAKKYKKEAKLFEHSNLIAVSAVPTALSYILCIQPRIKIRGYNVVSSRWLWGINI
jgi:hypothetical protein